MHKLSEGRCFLCIVHASRISGLDCNWLAPHMIYDKFWMWFCIFYFFQFVMFGFGLWALRAVVTFLWPWTLFLCWCFWTNLRFFIFWGYVMWTWTKFCVSLRCVCDELSSAFGGWVFAVGVVENCCSLIWIVLFSILFVSCLDPGVGSAFGLCEIWMMTFFVLWDDLKESW